MTGPDRVHSPFPPSQVRRPVMVQQWRTLTFLHWRYQPAQVQRLLPRGLQVETYDGAAWVGLVPFFMHVRSPIGGEIPRISRFPETNVRTYVVGPDGRPGVWFFSLDAGLLPAVVTARTAYRLPYFWADMRVGEDGPDLVYSSRRRWPGPAGASTSIRVRPGEPYPAADLTEFDHYLTARFGLYAWLGPRLAHSYAEHPPWPLRRADVLELTESVVTAAGLPAPVGTPIVHYSDGVTVKIGPPVPVRG